MPLIYNKPTPAAACALLPRPGAKRMRHIESGVLVTVVDDNSGVLTLRRDGGGFTYALKGTIDHAYELLD